MSDLCRDRLGIAGRRLPPAFERRAVTIGPGTERPYDAGEWFDSLVVVQEGAVELHSRSGDLARFTRGDVLWLTGLPLRSLHNPGPAAAVLVAISRTTTSGRGRRHGPTSRAG